MLIISYTSASISKKEFAKIVLFDRHVAEKWGIGVLPPENLLGNAL